MDTKTLPRVMSSSEAISLKILIIRIIPDALVQINQMFRISQGRRYNRDRANPGYDLRAKHENPEHCSSHGSLLKRDHMIVPIALNALKFQHEFN